MSLKELLKRKEQETLFAEYNSLAHKIRSLGDIVQNYMVLDENTTREDIKLYIEEWLEETKRRKAELDELIEATVRSVEASLPE